jgi:hypothetical protein
MGIVASRLLHSDVPVTIAAMQQRPWRRAIFDENRRFTIIQRSFTHLLSNHHAGGRPSP